MTIREVAVIGAGPAGLAAAIQLARSGIEAIVFERNEAGGLLRNAGLVENYPGFPEGIAGEDLARLFREQAERKGVVIRSAEVRGLKFKKGRFRLLLGSDEQLFRKVIVASGTKPNKFEFDIPPVFENRVMYEIAPILRETGKRIAIAGSGDAAFDYALTLGGKNLVHILNRGSAVKCLPLLQDRVKKNPSIIYLEKTSVTGIFEDRSNMCVECLTREGCGSFPVDYLIGAIGRRPCLDFLAPDFKSLIPKLEEKGMLSFAGDVKNGLSRQTAIAVGDGLEAAGKICRLIQEERA